MLYDTYEPAWGKVSRPGYGQKPYVHITLPDGRVFEGRAAAWAADKVLVVWYDTDAPPEYVVGIPIHTQYAWADAEHVERIKRRESAWQDPRDDIEYFEEQGEL